MRTRLIHSITTDDRDTEIVSSEEAKICLECPLPPSKCKFNHCKRYEQLMEEKGLIRQYNKQK